MGGQERMCLLSEGQGISAVQGDTIPAADQPNAELCEGAGAHSLNLIHYILIELFLRHWGYNKNGNDSTYIPCVFHSRSVLLIFWQKILLQAGHLTYFLCLGMNLRLASF